MTAAPQEALNTETLLHEVSHGTGSRKWAAALRRRAKTVARQADLSYVELAQILFKVYDTPIDGNPELPPIYTQWGFKSFHDYAFQELGLHYKKADRLKRIGYRLGVDLADLPKSTKDRLVRVGESKLRELVRVLTPETTEEWCSIAEQSTCAELYNAVRYHLQRVQQQIDAEHQKVNGSNGHAHEDMPAWMVPDREEDEPEPVTPAVDPQLFQRFSQREEPFVPKMFNLTSTQKDIVNQALDRSSSLSGSSKQGHNLTLICTDFLASNTFGKKGTERASLLARIEQLLNVRLIAVDPKNATSVIYGIDTLAELAGE